MGYTIIDQDGRERRSFGERMERATTGHNLRRMVFYITLAVSFMFWFYVFVLRFSPFAAGYASFDLVFRGVMDIILAALISLALSMVAPIAFSSWVPSTPANKLVAQIQQQFGMAGLIFGSLLAGYLVYEAFNTASEFWYMKIVPVDMQGGVLSAEYVWEIRRMAALMIVVTIGVPAWTFNQFTPEKWRAMVQEGREVRRLQHQMEMEEAAMQAAHAGFIATLQADSISQAASAWRNYGTAVATLHTYAVMQDKQIERIERCFQVFSGMATEAPMYADLREDEQAVMAGLFRNLNKELHRARHALKTAASDTASVLNGEPSDHMLGGGGLFIDRSAVGAEMREAERVPVAVDEAPAQRAEPDSLHNSAEFRAVAGNVGSQVFTKADVVAICKVAERTAQDSLALWSDAGLIKGAGRLGRYVITGETR